MNISSSSFKNLGRSLHSLQSTDLSKSTYDLMSNSMYETKTKSVEIVKSSHLNRSFEDNNLDITLLLYSDDTIKINVFDTNNMKYYRNIFTKKTIEKTIFHFGVRAG